MRRYCMRGFTVLGLLLPGFGVHALAQPTQSNTVAVAQPVRDMVEEYVSKNFVLPQTAQWRFDFEAPYAGGGNVVCGSVNYQSAQRTYVGWHRFLAIVRRDKVVTSQFLDPPSVDISGAIAERFRLLCDLRP